MCKKRTFNLEKAAKKYRLNDAVKRELEQVLKNLKLDQDGLILLSRPPQKNVRFSLLYESKQFDVSSDKGSIYLFVHRVT